ncbi:MAG: SIS domain-containing protein [Actinobacteria bacterium]|nr:MAG: SIS domain-containing protein [Actinomycetota bacterium]
MSRRPDGSRSGCRRTTSFSTTAWRAIAYWSVEKLVSSPSPVSPLGGHLLGEIFAREIHEQPEALRRLLEHEDDYAALARVIDERAPALIRLVGHGSSDNAATYGVYAFGLLPRLTAVRDSISLSVYYDAALDFSSSVVLALSQSGRTPDVVEYVKRARARGAFTVALTNGSGSELEQAADATLPLAAGPEFAVAATKTYLNQLAAIALLAGGIAGRGPELADGLRATADLLSQSLYPLEAAVRPVATSFAYVGRMYAIGRGLEFATAREVALKLTESCRIAAGPLTATDLAHGPVAALDSLFPVWTIASRDESLPAVIEAATRVRDAGATIVASGSAAGEIDASYTLPVPVAPSPLLAPLLSVVPGQLFAATLAQVKGYDADKPVGLNKVTIAR